MSMLGRARGTDVSAARAVAASRLAASGRRMVTSAKVYPMVNSTTSGSPRYLDHRSQAVKRYGEPVCLCAQQSGSAPSTSHCGGCLVSDSSPSDLSLESVASIGKSGDCALCRLLIVEIRKQQPDFAAIERMLEHSCCQHWRAADAELPLGALHKAAKAGEVSTIMALLDARVPVDMQSSLSWTALHYACGNNHVDAAMLLILRRADVNKPTLSGMTPLHVACVRQAEGSVLAVLGQVEQFVMVDYEDDQRQTPMSASRAELLRWLIREYRESPRGLAILCTADTKPALTKREAGAFGNSLQALIDERANARRRLGDAFWHWECNQFIGKIFPGMPQKIRSHVIMPFLFGSR